MTGALIEDKQDGTVEPASANGASQSAQPSLKALLESLLFVADTPVSIAKLAEALDQDVKETEEALVELDKLYHDQGRKLPGALRSCPASSGRQPKETYFSGWPDFVRRMFSLSSTS